MQFTNASFPAELPSLKKILEFLRGAAHDAGFSADDLDRLDLVIEEIAVNIFRYAYAETETGPVEVAGAVQGQGDLLVRISDQGVPFDPLARPEPDLHAALRDRPVGGLGVFLVTHLVTAISYERSDGWNKLSFRFCSEPGSK
jgi:serine/threonine-protein kinase RsbW